VVMSVVGFSFFSTDDPIEVSDIKYDPVFSASMPPQEGMQLQLDPLPTPVITPAVLAKPATKKKKKSGKKVTAHGDYVALC
jgi:hypothetical protein